MWQQAFRLEWVNLKPMLSVGKESIIRRTIRLMKNAGADPIIVVTGYCREILEAFEKSGR